MSSDEASCRSAHGLMGSQWTGSIGPLKPGSSIVRETTASRDGCMLQRQAPACAGKCPDPRGPIGHIASM
jgi:hypothetical protein